MQNFFGRLLLIAIIFFFGNVSYSQQFSAKPLITIPGENFDFDIATNTYIFNSYPKFDNKSYIVWVNKSDSLYSIYCAKLDFQIDSVALITSSTETIKHARISFVDYWGSSLRIVWQSFENGKWRIKYTTVDNELKVDKIITLSDTTHNCISPTVCKKLTAWVDEDKLLAADMSDTSFTPVVVDSGNISNPDLGETFFERYVQLVYQKKDLFGDKIYLAGTEPSGITHWGTSELQSESIDNVNPRFGAGDGITFETKIDSFWAVYLNLPAYYFPYISIGSYDIHNPIAFGSILIIDIFPSLKKNIFEDHFLVFDCDPFQTDKEIYLINLNETGELSPPINISNSAGDDYSPNIGMISTDDSLFIDVVWIHEENNTKQIWRALAFHGAIPDAVNETQPLNYSFDLQQNYPNPFNPSTKITYEIKNSGNPEHVRLYIYNTLGQEIAVLVDEYQSGGTYSVDFKGESLTSGVYFYKLSVGNNTLTKKMLLLK